MMPSHRPAPTWLAVAAVAWTAVASALAQAPDHLFRVFLRDGSSLASYGDVAVAGDRVVFTLAVGEGADVRLQLMSLSAGTVDLEKTGNYSRAVRASYYAATRGEADYTAMTEQVSSAIEYLTKVTDPKERLRLAEEARRRLLSWSRENYSYRASDIAVLAGLFDEVIGELRAAAGQSSFTLDLSTGTGSAPLEPLLAPPSLRESIAMALSAARAADVSEERLAILRTALDALAERDAETGLRADVARELEIELAVGEAYRLLSEEFLGRAEVAVARGNVNAVTRLQSELAQRDAALGRRRPADLLLLERKLSEILERTVSRRMTLDRYAAARAGIYTYEREVRPALSGIDGLRPVLEHLRDQRFFNFQRLETSIDRFNRFLALVRSVAPPPEVADLHATLLSALHMAQQASARRRLAVVTGNGSFDLEASAAAAGALMLADQVRRELLDRLSVPRQ